MSDVVSRLKKSENPKHSVNISSVKCNMRRLSFVFVVFRWLCTKPSFFFLDSARLSHTAHRSPRSRYEHFASIIGRRRSHSFARWLGDHSVFAAEPKVFGASGFFFRVGRCVDGGGGRLLRFRFDSKSFRKLLEIYLVFVRERMAEGHAWIAHIRWHRQSHRHSRSAEPFKVSCVSTPKSSIWKKLFCGSPGR